MSKYKYTHLTNEDCDVISDAFLKAFDDVVAHILDLAPVGSDEYVMLCSMSGAECALLGKLFVEFAAGTKKPKEKH